MSGASWGVLGRVWASLGRLGASLERLGASLGRLEPSLGRLGPSLGRLGAPFWLPLAPFGDHFGLILAAWGSHLASPGEGSRNVAKMSRFCVAFGPHFGTKFH